MRRSWEEEGVLTGKVGRSAGRDEGHGEGRTGNARAVAQSELDVAAQAAGLAVDEGDAVAAVLGEMALRIADDEHVAQEHEADGAEVATVDVPLERLGRVIVPASGSSF